MVGLLCIEGDSCIKHCAVELSEAGPVFGADRNVTGTRLPQQLQVGRKDSCIKP